MGRWLRPRSMQEALALLAADPAPMPFGGRTDLHPTQAARFAWGLAFPDARLDLGAPPGLAAIQEASDHWRIGARVTWAALRDAALPPEFDALRAAAREVGGAQIQNRGTIAG